MGFLCKYKINEKHYCLSKQKRLNCILFRVTVIAFFHIVQKEIPLFTKNCFSCFPLTLFQSHFYQMKPSFS